MTGTAQDQKATIFALCFGDGGVPITVEVSAAVDERFRRVRRQRGLTVEQALRRLFVNWPREADVIRMLNTLEAQEPEGSREASRSK